jgi:hypothetical protein
MMLLVDGDVGGMCLWLWQVMAIDWVTLIFIADD